MNILKENVAYQNYTYQECCQKFINKQIELHRDTVPAHSAKLIMKFRRSAGIKLMLLPPYNPDLPLCDLPDLPLCDF